MGAFWADLPLALQIAIAAALVFLAALVMSRLAPERSAPGMDTIPKSGWRIVERLSAILGILSFAAQIVQWILEWRR